MLVMTHWYLVYTKPRNEFVAQQNLKRQGYESYLPLIRQSRRRKGRQFENIEPLFPRYLFVRFSPGHDNIAPIGYTTGVSGLVRFAEEPAVVSDQIIESLRRRADCDTGLHCPKAPLFVPGDTVIIDEGPLSGVESIYLAQTGSERVVVLLQLLGRENHVRIERNLLRVG